MKKFVLLALASLPLSVFAQGGLPDKPYIYVEGRAEIEKPADVVTLRFDLVARNPDQAKANQEVQAKAAKVFAMTDARKIAELDVVATDLKSAPQFENDDESGNKRGKIIGYTVTRSFTVRVRDVTTFAKLVDELVAIGSTEFSGIEGGLSNEKAMEDEAWDKALLNGRERAEKTVKTMGMRIDSVFAISPVAFPEIQSKIFGSSLQSASYTARELAKPDPMQYRLAPVTISQERPHYLPDLAGEIAAAALAATRHTSLSSMPSVVFLRAINVGKANRCRPAEIAKTLAKFDVVNIGAVGTFVVRKEVSESALRSAISRQLPFKIDIMICPARDILKLAAKDPFAGQPSGPTITRFVNVLAKPISSQVTRHIPLALPENDWLVKVIAIKGRFVLGVYRREIKAIAYLGKIEKLLGVPATNRNWTTIEKVIAALQRAG